MTEGEIRMPGFGRWGDDIRLEILKSVVGRVNDPSQEDADTMLRTISALARHVAMRRRSVVPGLGTFEWRLFDKVIPPGKWHKCAVLRFRLARKEHDIARQVFKTGGKTRAKSAPPCIETAVRAATRRGK